MEQKCLGENCNSTDGRNHSVECLFEHFMAYTSAHKEVPGVQAKLKKAYFDGHEAGCAAFELMPTEYSINHGMMALLECSLSDLSSYSSDLYEGYRNDVIRVFKAMASTSNAGGNQPPR